MPRIIRKHSTQVSVRPVQIARIDARYRDRYWRTGARFNLSAHFVRSIQIRGIAGPMRSIIAVKHAAIIGS
jgi:hypothetical protein